jgi:hypothetical protein
MKNIITMEASVGTDYYYSSGYNPYTLLFVKKGIGVVTKRDHCNQRD